VEYTDPNETAFFKYAALIMTILRILVPLGSTAVYFISEEVRAKLGPKYFIDPRRVRFSLSIGAILYLIPAGIAFISFLLTVPLDIFILWGTTRSPAEADKIARNQQVRDIAGYSLAWLGVVGVLAMFLFTSATFYLSSVDLGDIELTLYNCLVTWLIMQALSTGAAASFNAYLEDVIDGV
jgi:hypothetical protein